jgi:hypothetical protein
MAGCGSLVFDCSTSFLLLLQLHLLLLCPLPPPKTPTTTITSQTYGRELSEAYEWIQKFKVSRKEAELHQAWDLYYHVFKRINKQLHSLTTLELQYVAPALVSGGGRGGAGWDGARRGGGAVAGCSCTASGHWSFYAWHQHW